MFHRCCWYGLPVVLLCCHFIRGFYGLADMKIVVIEYGIRRKKKAKKRMNRNKKSKLLNIKDAALIWNLVRYFAVDLLFAVFFFVVAPTNVFKYSEIADIVGSPLAGWCKNFNNLYFDIHLWIITFWTHITYENYLHNTIENMVATDGVRWAGLGGHG